MGRKLYVGNLSYDTTDDALREVFGQDGRQVASVNVMMDRDTGRPRGFAFVEMATDEDARKAIDALDGQMLDGRNLKVNEAEAKKPGFGGGGGGGGRGHGGGNRGGGRPRY